MKESDGAEVTGRRLDVLREIARLEGRVEAVTTARLAASLNIPRQNVRTYLLALRDRGLVLYEANERQNAVIRLTEAGRNLDGGRNDTLALPIVGEVAAGAPSFAEENIEGYAARLSDLLDVHQGDFLLRVRGESMVGVGIFPSDFVVIRPLQDEPHNGEIALVAVPGENTATLKRWHRNNGTVTLFSENPSFEPLTYKVEQVEIRGCLVGHVGTGRTRRTQTP